MRRVDAEGDSRGVRGQRESGPGSRSRLRRAAIEWLERRELLSTSTSKLPSPTVISAPNLTPNQQVQDASLATAAVNLTAAPQASSPSVSVDPINPLKMVATWVNQDPAGYNDGGNITPAITSYIQGAYSLDGGKTWTALPSASFGGANDFGTTVNLQQDFTVTPAPGPLHVFSETTDASVAFDRNENFYILSSTHNVPAAVTGFTPAGVLDLQRWSFVGANTPKFNGTTQVYSWDMTDGAANGGTADAAVTPTLAVDTNLSTFTDPTTNRTVTDAFSGNIYAVWAEVDSPVYNNAIPNFNPDTIRMSVSSDQGLFFTHAAYVDDSSNANGHNIEVASNPPPPPGILHDSNSRYAEPQVAISQGNASGTVPAGQVTIVYDDHGTVVPVDQIFVQTNTVGGTSAQFSYSNTMQLPNIGAQIPITVNITDPKFTTLQDLDVTTTIAWPNISEIGAVLVPPAPVLAYLQKFFGPTYPGIALFQGDVGINNSSGTPSSSANLGATSGTGVGFGTGSGTVFDPEAVRSIEDGNAGATAAGHYTPDDEEAFLLLKGLAATAKGALPGLNGVWQFATEQFKADTSTSPKFVNGVTLNFTSGANPGSTVGVAGDEVLVAGKNTLFASLVPNINPTNATAANAYGVAVNTDNTGSPFFNGVAGTNVSGSGNTASTVQPGIPILPAPVIASDDSLGSFSQHSGRIYVAFTGEFTGAQAGNTDVFLAFSDDGGKTWKSALAGANSVEQVNDDNSPTGGFSGSVAGTNLGRTQFEPLVAVDPSTGDVVLSFYDARNDPSNARVATYIAASEDGGGTFAAEVYANPSSFATDAVTGAAVNLGPIPDNEDNAAGGGVESVDGYGVHQALVVTNGRIVPFWTSDQNMAIPTAIADSILSLPAGPRVISSTQGPVDANGDATNTSQAADGTPLANTILLTFDKPVDPASFSTANVGVYFKSPTGGASISLPILSVAAVAGTAVADTEWKIVFNPGSLTSKVGTYSYVIIPTTATTTIKGLVRTANAPVNTAGVFGFVAPAGTGVPATQGYASSSVGVSGHPGQYLVADPTGAAARNLAFPNGNVAGTITATITAGAVAGSLSPPTAANFIVNLVTPDGQRVALNGVVSMDKSTYTLTATKFTIPWVDTVALDGNYTLEVIDNVGTETIAISVWQLTLNGVLATPSSNTGSVMDQNGDGTPGQLSGDNISTTAFNAQAGDNYVVGQPTGFSNYSPGTLPLIVPGPHVTATAALSSTGAVIGSGTNDLVLNNSVSAVQVAFDRNIQVGSFNAAQILRIYGPAGAVSLAGITITPLAVFTPSGQVAYVAGGATADLFKISFATQQLSGTYSITIGTGILAADGSGVDANLNAGLDVLRGTATNGVTTPDFHPAVSPAVPVTIAPETVNPDGTTTPSVLMSPIVVPVDFPIQGDNTTTGVSGVTLSLNINYPTDPDLVAYLLSPPDANGKQVQINLFTRVGAGTNTANFTSTTFSDTATTSVDKTTAPFFGTFLPESPFANLAAAGLDTLGTWTLVIQNNGSNTGMLTSWSLTFQKPVSSTGLAESPDDQSTVGFQIFNLAASNTLANSTWTAVGPAGITPTANGKGTFAGAISTTAVDPSDKTGNTVYVGSASGGIWKTTDFLTTNPAGPTYQPLTDFGPDFSLNVGSIAIFGKNNDPAQSVIFAGTGFGQEATKTTAGTPNVDLNSGRGVGILRSTDGGVSWALLDSTDNSLGEAARDHQFLGDTTYKIVVDPTPTLSGGIIVYAAMGGPTGGLYQSLDSGNTWKLLSSSIEPGQFVNADDVLLDPNSKSPTTGNLDTIYASFGTFGVYVSTNQGQTLQVVGAQLGKDPLIVTPGFPATPIAVQNSLGVSPNNILGSYVVLGKPALTSSVSENLDYQGWLYAAVENGDGTFNGLYVTKDAGENWTKVQLGNIPGGGSVKDAVPTNTTTGTNSYDPTSSNFSKQGQYDLTLTVDPTNPNILYLGGSQDFQESGLIRVDLTELVDAHNFTSFSNNRTDGGLLTANSQGGVDVANAGMAALYEPIGAPAESQILNLRYAPNNGTPGTSPFNINATLVAGRVAAAGFVNDGTGVTWTTFDEPLKANAGDLTGSTNLHQVVDYVDPTTGDVRLLFADDEGIFTALVNPDGTLNNGIGTAVAEQYSRNGNIQNEQFFDSAAQPSFVASQAAGALFYASGQTNLAAQSDANILTDGNLTWDNGSVLDVQGTTSPRNTTANASIVSSDRSGVGIATDQTGGVSAASPSGSPSLYEFDVPILGGNLTDFFRVNQFGQTTGLSGATGFPNEFPTNNYRGPAVAGGSTTALVTAANNGQVPLGDFAVNPLNGQQILIGSALGNLYESVNQGISFTKIGVPSDFQIANGGNAANVQFSAITYGAPDPNVSGGVGNLNNFIYVGTTGGVNPSPPTIEPDGLAQDDGRIFFTQAGGQGWVDASKGLDGSTVVGIYPDPDRGSHAAYAVTLTGVFYSPDTVGLANAGQAVWTNITSNLAAIQRNPFGNAAYQESVLAGFVGQNSNNPTDTNVFTAQYGGFTDVVADYRYEIPAATNATQGTNIFFPVLYVSGYGGVFRSIDNGATWTVFPDTAFDAAPVDGGYLPSVDVTNLQLVLGDINPDTGHPTQNSNSTVTNGQPDPEVLLATTFGRGDFAIRLAPDVIPDSVAFDPNLPVPNGSDSGISNIDLITNVEQPFIDGVSEISNYGNLVTINFFDQSRNPDGTPTAGFGTLLGTGETNAIGQFVHLDPADGKFDLLGIQIVNSGQDPSFFASSTAVADKVVGIRATDSSGASGNLTLFSYTLDLITPVTPDQPVLEAVYDTGRFNNDDLTNLSVPAQAGPGGPLTIATPTFDVTTNLPQANPLTPVPISLTIELLRATSPTGPFFLIDSTQTGFVNQAGTAETYMLTDADAAAQAAAGIDETFYYEALQIDSAGNVSATASPVLPVTIDTLTPATPTGLTLDASTNSGGTNSSPYQTNFINPLFDVTGIQPNDQVLLYRSVNGGAPMLVSDPNPANAVINTTNAPATLKVADFLGATMDGIYTYYAAELDVYGNFSLLTAPITVTISTEQPPAIPILEAAYDTGRSRKDDVTDIAVPAPTPGVAPTFVSPVFDVNTVAPAGGQPPISTVQLFRATSPTGPFAMVGTTTFGGNPAMVADSTLQAIVAAAYAAGKPIDQTYYYEADDVNAAGIESAKSKALAVLVDTITPATLTAPSLDTYSNTGLDKAQLITNQVHPYFDFTNLQPGDQTFLYRSHSGGAPILVGAYPAINNTTSPINGLVQDTLGATTDGVYQYFVVQQDLAGNISNFSPSIAVTVNTTTPVAPTIALLATDDTGLPSHPDVTSVNTPHFIGTAPYNPSPNFPIYIINAATGQLLTSVAFYPAANGTYEAQITTPLPDGVYQLQAVSINQAGTPSYSTPLTVTIKHLGPQIVPTLTLLPADDTGIKGDGVTTNHDPRFTGVTDKGDTVSLYALVNGVLLGPEAVTTASTINGSFTFALPFNLTNGYTQLVAQTSDIANNKGVLSSPYAVRITSNPGDYLGFGKAQFTVFDPYIETYFVRNIGAFTVDSTPGRDIPIQYDLNGDGATDLSAYRYNTAEYYGFISNGTTEDFAFGAGGSSLPVSGYYGFSGTYIPGSYQPSTGTWAIELPQPGGLVINFGVPRLDIPEPAAYNGNGSTELAVFRPSTFFGGDADSFTVFGPTGPYMVSYTSAAVAKLGFVYKPGDIADPGDYDGVGRDEFAVYRPSTGQFFILNTPNVANTATWTLRTVGLNLPGGPKAGDQPVSEDYDGDGKVDPTVFRPSNSTFYSISTITGLQNNVPFGPANQSVAAAGPILYRLTALFGAYATTGGYTTTVVTGVTGGLLGGSSIPGGSVHAESIASPTTTTTTTTTTTASASGQAGSPLATMIAVAAPLPVASAAPAPVAPTTTPVASGLSVTVGASTPRSFVPTVVARSAATTSAAHAKAKKPAKPVVVEETSHAAPAKVKVKVASARAVESAAAAAHAAQAHAAASAAQARSSHAKSAAMAATSLQHLVMAAKGRKKS